MGWGLERVRSGQVGDDKDDGRGMLRVRQGVKKRRAGTSIVGFMAVTVSLKVHRGFF